MNKEISRRAAAGPIAAFPILGLSQTPSYRMRVLDTAQAEAVEALSEAIIPATDTPGARAARVHEYIDEALAANTDQKDDFLSGLEWVEKKAMRDYGKPFAQLESARQTELLTSISDDHKPAAGNETGAAFFRQLKTMVCTGYYLSAIGLKQELRYKGNAAVRDYPACTHTTHG